MSEIVETIEAIQIVAEAIQEDKSQLKDLESAFNSIKRGDIDLYRYLEFMSTGQEINIANLNYNLDTVKAMASHFKTDIVLGWA